MVWDESMGAQPGFFDVDHRMKRLSDLGDQLEAFGSAVDFEIFRGDLVLALAYSENGQGGRPPFDPVMMFKILVIQAANNLSDERTEFLINDRLSFMRFLGLGLSDRVPDARTIWLFRRDRRWLVQHAILITEPQLNPAQIQGFATRAKATFDSGEWLVEDAVGANESPGRNPCLTRSPRISVRHPLQEQRSPKAVPMRSPRSNGRAGRSRPGCT
jgi:hypothetical protein